MNEDCAWKKRGNLVFGDCWPQEGMKHIGFPRYKAREWEEENQHTWPSWVVLADENVCIRAAPLRHPVPCFGYVIEEKDRDGHMKVEWLTEQGLPPSPLYKDFKAGKSVESPKEPGRIIEEARLPRGAKIILGVVRLKVSVGVRDGRCGPRIHVQRGTSEELAKVTTWLWLVRTTKGSLELWFERTFPAVLRKFRSPSTGQ